MNNEEQYILNRCGKQNPFTVPEGYFDSLRTELMQRVEVKPKDISLWKRWRGYVAAACMIGVVAGVATYIGFGSEATENKHVAARGEMVGEGKKTNEGGGLRSINFHLRNK